MADPIVSVIVPVYNAEKFLNQSLTSIEKQTLKDIEIIVLNDGSTDSSSKIIKKHAKRNSRIQVLNKKNEGYGKTCNKGIKRARGEWIAIVEPDDWIDEDMYYDMVNFACESELKFHKKIDIVKTPWYDVKEWDDAERQHEVRSYLYSRLKTDLRPTDITEKTAMLEKHPSVWSAIYRRSFLKDNKIKFPKIPGSGWADNPFMIDTLITAKSIVYLNRPYYHYRCDLLGATLNHKDEAQISLPFDRWCEMTDKLHEMCVKDEGVWKAHYKRGLDYVHGAIIDDGWENPIVQQKAKQVFDMMDTKLLLSLETFYPKVKELYAKVEGLDVSIPKFSKQQVNFYLKETALFLKGRGVKDTAKLAVRHMKRLINS